MSQTYEWPEGTVNFMDAAACRKLGESNAWQVYRWEIIDDGNSDRPDFIVEGGVPRKGQRTFRDFTGDKSRKTVITWSEIQKACEDYEAETGKCKVCCGTGQENIGWNHETGNKYQNCPRCGATGKAPFGGAV